MKVKFTKLAALLLAGAALFATGCTDYEVDIQKVDKKVDNLTADVNGKISSIEQQIAGINATIATLETQAKHDEDIQKLNKTITDLETALKADYEKKIKDAVDNLTAAINKKVDQTEFDAAKQALTEALNTANGKIQALEKADQDFQKQIETLTQQFTAALAAITNPEGTGALDVLAKDYAALKTLVTGQISDLQTRMAAAEAALEDLTKEPDGVIPSMKKQIADLEAFQEQAEKDIEALQSGKLDKTEFDAYYKTAYEKYTKATIDLMQSAIDDLAANKLDAETFNKKMEELDQQIADINKKFDDYVLKTTFNAFVEIAATKEELNALKSNLEGQINGLKSLIGEFPENTTVREYIDNEVNGLKAKLSEITNEAGTGRLDVLEDAEAALEDVVNNTILKQLKFALDYEEAEGIPAGYGLQAYIDEGDAWALTEAKNYTDGKIQLVMDVINDMYDEIYGVLAEALGRVQSIAFVPDYDDNKITVELVYNVDPQTGKWTVLGKETVVTYKVTPADAAKAVVAEYANKPESFFFDVKAVKTRADGDEDEGAPAFKVVDVKMNEANADKGWVDVTVIPENIADEFFAYNQVKAVPPVVKPLGAMTTYATGEYEDGWILEEGDLPGGFYFVYAGGLGIFTDEWYEEYEELYDEAYDAYYEWYFYGYDESEDDELYVAYLEAIEALNTFVDEKFAEFYGDINDVVDPIMESYDKYFEDLQKQGAAKTFAAALVIDSATPSMESYNEDFTEIPVNLSSQFNVLYPSKFEDSDQFTILDDPYYKDETGKYVPVEEHQKLPYNSDEIKTIFKDAVAVVEYKGELYSYDDLRDMGFSVPELPKTEGKVAFIPGEGKNYAINSDKIKKFFQLDQETGTLPISADNELIDSYDVQMNQGRAVAELAEAVGDKAAATYQFYTLVGSFFATGDVEVTKPLYTVHGTATIDWDYEADKEVDHARYYLRHDVYNLQSEPYTDEEKTYGREVVDIVLDASEVAGILEDSGVSPEEIAAITEEPELTVKVAAKEGADELTEEEAAALAAAVKFTNLVFDPETQELTVSATGFEFDYVYTVTAVYKNDLPIELTLEVVLTTNDRNRETMVVNLTPYPKKVLVNGPDYDAETDLYTVQSDDVREAVQALFEEEGILTVAADGDYEDTDAFVAGELIFKKAYADRESNTELPAAKQSKWIDIQQVYGTTKGRKVTSAVLKEIDGQDLVRTVSTYIGQEIELTWKLVVDLPVFDFQHNETFVTSGEPIYVAPERGTVGRGAKDNGEVYYTDVHPDYNTREVLEHFDVSNVDLLARPFDIVDAEGNKLIVDPDQDIDEIADNNLIVYFTWWDLPGDSRIVWVEETEKEQHTIDYGGLDPAVRVVGHIEMAAAGNPDVTFTLPTKFDEGKLYDLFEVRQFKPFKELEDGAVTVDISRHQVIETKIFDAIKFEDVRGKVLYENGDWVTGDGTEANGFAEGVKSYDAYGIEDWENALDFETAGVPEDLRSLIWFDYETQTMYFDYSSELPLYKENSFTVTVTITTQWQILTATLTVTIPKNA